MNYKYTHELSMDLNDIKLNDIQLRVFNSRSGFHPYHNSATGLHMLVFPGKEVSNGANDYQFRLRFNDKINNQIINDFVPQMWINSYNGTTNKNKDFEQDPLGCNFRDGSYYLLILQKEEWYPSYMYRKAIFNKIFKKTSLNFSMETKTTCSADKDYIIMEVDFENKSNDDIDFIIDPIQLIKTNEYSLSEEDEIRGLYQIDRYTIETEFGNKVVVSSDLPNTKEGFELKLKAKESILFYVQIAIEELENSNIKEEFNKSLESFETRLVDAYEKLPVLETSDERLDLLYKKSILSVLECKWEHEDFVYSPFYTVGTWILSVLWDNSFASEMLIRLSTEDFKQTIIKQLEISKHQHSYLLWNGDNHDIFYIQELFAYKELIQKYIDHTNDYEILNYKLENKNLSIYEYLYNWMLEIRELYANEDELLDVGENTEILIEIRTDGYSGIIPVVNIHFNDLYNTLLDWSTFTNVTIDATKLKQLSLKINSSIEKLLWNEKTGWYNNIIDGEINQVYTYHLFDILNSNSISTNNKVKMINKLKPGNFLGRNGIYSIAKMDEQHYDIIDADWGGGGQFPGMTLRIILYLFENGYTNLAYDILSRISNYSCNFPYIPQNARIDKDYIDISSMPLQLSSGATLEVITKGIFGIKEEKKSLIINPNYDESIQHLKLTNYNFKNKKIEIELKPDKYVVLVDNVMHEKYYSQALIII